MCNYCVITFKVFVAIIQHDKELHQAAAVSSAQDATTRDRTRST